MQPNRVLILSWEYPPLIEGGLARHVRKLSEALVELGVEAHVLTRGGEESPPEDEVAGVQIHRVREPKRPADLGEFVAWVERMNVDMLAAGVELGDRYGFDLVHGHDWLVATAGDHLARRFDAPLLTTIHATEYGRHQGWVDKHPQSHIHGVERWITNRADRVIVCSFYMREQVADIFGVPQERVSVIWLMRHAQPRVELNFRRTYWILCIAWGLGVFVGNYLFYLIGIMSFLPWLNNALHTFVWIGLCLSFLYAGCYTKPMWEQCLLFIIFSFLVKVGEHWILGTWELPYFFFIPGNLAYLIGWSVLDGLYPYISMVGLKWVSRFVQGVIVPPAIW